MRHRVRMLETVFAAENGIHAKPYFKGKTYNVADHLVAQFVQMGVIELEDDREYDIMEAPENRVDNPPKRRGRPPKDAK